MAHASKKCQRQWYSGGHNYFGFMTSMSSRSLCLGMLMQCLAQFSSLRDLSHKKKSCNTYILKHHPPTTPKKSCSCIFQKILLTYLLSSTKIQQEWHFLTDPRLGSVVLPHNLDDNKSTPLTSVPHMLQISLSVCSFYPGALCSFLLCFVFVFFCAYVTTFCQKSRFLGLCFFV